MSGKSVLQALVAPVTALFDPPKPPDPKELSKKAAKEEGARKKAAAQALALAGSRAPRLSLLGGQTSGVGSGRTLLGG